MSETMHHTVAGLLNTAADLIQGGHEELERGVTINGVFAGTPAERALIDEHIHLVFALRALATVPPFMPMPSHIQTCLHDDTPPDPPPNTVAIVEVTEAGKPKLSREDLNKLN